jgi:hypothetical protein
MQFASGSVYCHKSRDWYSRAGFSSLNQAKADNGRRLLRFLDGVAAVSLSCFFVLLYRQIGLQST